MRTLTLLRHAKSAWTDPVLRDFDRPLNARGQKAAATIGRHLREAGVGFDHVVASPAVRVTETLEHFYQGFGTKFVPTWDRRIYLASSATLIDVLREAPEDAKRVLMVGHNPGLEDLVFDLVPPGGPLREAVEEKYPTAAIAEMALPIDDWAQITSGRATLERFVRPRDLDPALGPDDD
ncbi:SixA phosphatase family protein [Sphingomonas japonica]|uniref:Phosphohistidine phosphatase n=1 Tax=Sphingomonas japonica TaxID=511662 RepID=A0ABX0U3M6_9SPHN|nr:histidine phosphatase family protein [Sphingomonas japonica]NIJ23981.1 phosphohistidine phosphatase [Sphingomonas japonica]